MADPEKAFLTFENDQNSKLYFMFNPESIKIAMSNRWEGTPAPGRPAPRQKFGGQDAGKLDLTIWFDTTDTGGSVTDFTNQLLAKMEIDSTLPGTDPKMGNARPPTCTFHWGQNLTSFPAVITSANVTFNYFSSTGVPLRAQVDLSLVQYSASRAYSKQNPTSGTPEPHRVHRVQPGETLDRISASYYGDPTRWRLLASANGIEDPLGIRPGSLLSIPLAGSA